MTRSRTFLNVLVVLGVVTGLGCATKYDEAIPERLLRSREESASEPSLPLRVAAQRVDLPSALRLAAGSHLDVLLARAQLREAQGNASRADGYLLPVLGAGVSWGRVVEQNEDSFGNLRPHVNFGRVNALGTLSLSLNPGESIYHDLAAHRLEAAAQDVELAQLNLVLLEISREYLALVESDGLVRLSEQYRDEAAAILRLAEARQLRGIGSAFDTERARNQLAESRQKTLAFRIEREKRSKVLAASLRMDSSLDLNPVDQDLAPATLVRTDEALDRWLERALAHRPEEWAYRSQREAADKELSAAHWSVWGPRLGATYNGGELGRSIPTLDDHQDWVFTFGWTFSFGGPGTIEAAAARRDQAELLLFKFQDRMLAAVSSAYKEVQLSRERLAPSQDQLDSAELALRLARANFQGGLLSESDLLLAQQAANQARRERLSAIAQYNLSQLSLLTQAGVGSVEVFGQGAGK